MTKRKRDLVCKDPKHVSHVAHRHLWYSSQLTSDHLVILLILSTYTGAERSNLAHASTLQLAMCLRMTACNMYVLQALMPLIAEREKAAVLAAMPSWAYEYRRLVMDNNRYACVLVIFGCDHLMLSCRMQEGASVLASALLLLTSHSMAPDNALTI